MLHNYFYDHIDNNYDNHLTDYLIIKVIKNYNDIEHTYENKINGHNDD